MKSYDETINNVFGRIGEYEKIQKRKRSVIIKGAVSFCCVCAIALVGVGVWQGTKPSSHTYTNPDTAITNLTGDLILDGIPDSDVIIFNEIKDILIEVPDENGIALFLGDEVTMTKDELNEYYGVNVFPTLPDGFEETTKWLGVYRKDKGTGEVYYDTNKLQYATPDGSKTIVVNVDDVCYLAETPDGNKSAFAEMYLGDVKESVINGIKVMMADVKFGRNFYAEFVYEGVQFGVWSENATQEEFLTVIYSLIK